MEAILPLDTPAAQQNGHAPLAGGDSPRTLAPDHRSTLIDGSGIAPHAVERRGAFTITDEAEFVRVGFHQHQWAGRGILFPVFPPGARHQSHFSYRPDSPADGRKYVQPQGVSNRLDVPPDCQHLVGNPRAPMIVTEGVKKADALVSHLPGYLVVGLSGVDNWRGTNAQSGKTALPDFEMLAMNGREVVVAFDSDAERKPSVKRARRRFRGFAESRGAIVSYLILPDRLDGAKCGVDDYLLDHSPDDLLALVRSAADCETRPVIALDGGDYNEVVDQCVALLHADGRFFRRGHQMVTVGPDDAGRAQATTLTEHGLTYHLAELADFTSRRSPKEKPPTYLAQTVLSQKARLPELRGVVTVPVLGPDGELVQEPGYDPGTRLWLDPDGRTPRVADSPSAEEVTAARELVSTLVSGFPFDGDASRANAIALLMLPFVRAMVDAPTPLHMVEAPTQGSGKTLLARVLLRAYVRDSLSELAAPGNEEEWNKLIVASLLDGASAFFIDNLKQELASPALAAALTSRRYSSRVLGSSQTMSAVITWPWVFTANNPVVDVDIARRTVQIRLVPHVEDPWRIPQDQFPVPDIERWATEHEGELAAAALTLGRAWVCAGKPPGRVSLGSFDAWAGVVGGILSFAGFPGFLGNLETFYEQASSEGTAWREFVRAWWGAKQDADVRSSELYDLLQQTDVDIRLSGRDEPARRRSFGHQLRKQLDRIYGGLQVVAAGKKAGGVSAYRLVRVGPAPVGPEPEEGPSGEESGVSKVSEVPNSSLPRGESQGYSPEPSLQDGTPDTFDTPFERMISVL